MRANSCLAVLLAAMLGSAWQPLAAQANRGPSGPFTVVVASVPRLAAAEALLAKVPNTTEALVIKANTRLGQRYRVCIGRYLERPAAERQRLAVLSLFPEAWLLALGDTVLSIEPSKSKLIAPPVGSLEGFLAAYATMMPAFEQMDARRAQQFIHPELGLWVRHKPGAFAVVQRCASLNEVMELSALESAASRAGLEACWGEYRTTRPRSATQLPEPCPAPDTTDTLIVLGLSPKDLTLAAAYSAMKGHLVGPQLSADEARMLARVESLQQYIVIHRTARPIRALYFGLVEGRWVLTQLDLICEPL